MGKNKKQIIIERLQMFNGSVLHALHWRNIISSHIGSDDRTIMSTINMLRDFGALKEVKPWLYELNLKKIR